MKNLLLILTFIAICCGCREIHTVDGEAFSNFKEIRIEGCQYFKVVTSYDYNVITHKGNCDNPIHACR